jgi:V/A-type H+-transporting ATPase subunit I
MLIDLGNNTRIDAEEIHLKETPSEIKKKIESARDEIKSLNEKIHQFTKFIDLLKKEALSLQKKIDFEKAVKSGTLEAEDKIIILEGWAPKTDADSLNTMLDQEKILHVAHKPIVEDDVPVKLKNNRFARLFESIEELYTLPNYKELDLTPFFAPFYMLFFGFCLGDAGYGLLITLATIYAIPKVKPKLKPILKLGMFLGIATTIMGIVSGTFFGILLIDKPWPWLSGFKKIMLDNDQLMMFALILGYAQVLFGMFIKAANKGRMYGFKHSISQYGWIIIVLVSIPALILKSQGIIAEDLGNRIAIISAIIGGIPALFYNSPGKNPLMNLGVGLWDSYQTASGLLGDVLSYIRLFALGISSAILGNVFNTLAMELSPDTIILRQIVMVLILLFGHSLNFFMAALGSFVHPLRLTFVEFYKNAGFTGGGKKYDPFSNEVEMK